MCQHCQQYNPRKSYKEYKWNLTEIKDGLGKKKKFLRYCGSLQYLHVLHLRSGFLYSAHIYMLYPSLCAAKGALAYSIFLQGMLDYV